MGLVIALAVLILLLAGAGAAIHFLWIVAVVLAVLWVVGFFVRGVEGRWYGRRW